MPTTRERFGTIWSLTWPQLVMLLCQFLIGVTDVWAGGQISADVQAAIGLIAQCQMFLMTLAMAAVSGAVASVSQSLGAGKTLRAHRYIGLVIVGGISVGIAFALLASYWQKEFLTIIQTPTPLLPTAELFFNAYIWSLPAQYTLTLGAAVFRAVKTVVMPLYVTLGVALLNIAGDLAFGLGWWGMPAYGASGIAWATFVSVTAGALGMLVLLCRRGLLTRRAFPCWRWTRRGAPYLLQVAMPSVATSFLWQSGYLVLFIIVASLPAGSINALAGLTTGLRVEAILFLPAVACNMTASVLVGHALGANNTPEAKRLALSILWSSCAGMSCVGALLWPWRAELAALFTTDPLVHQETVSYLSYNILSVPFTVISVVLAGVFNGAGATVYPLWAFSLAVWGVRLPIAYGVGLLLWQQASGVYLAMLLSQIAQAAFLLWVLLRYNWTRFSMHATAQASRRTAPV